MTNSIELKFDKVSNVIKGLPSETFLTGDVIKSYDGSFSSNTGTPIVDSYNAHFGKWLKRNDRALGITEIEREVRTVDDQGYRTKNSHWRHIVHSSPMYELLLSSPHHASSTKSRRTVADIFRLLVDKFPADKIPYAITGTLALGMYARPRHTDVISLISLDRSRALLGEALLAKGFLLGLDSDYKLSFEDLANQVDIEIILAKPGLETSAVESSIQAIILGAPTMLIKLEYLLYMYCNSELITQHSEAIHLLQSELVDTAKMRRFFESTGDTAAAKQFELLLEKSIYDSKQSYSANVKERLARLTPFQRSRRSCYKTFGKV